jgi:hypothetical protein
MQYTTLSRANLTLINRSSCKIAMKGCILSNSDSRHRIDASSTLQQQQSAVKQYMQSTLEDRLKEDSASPNLVVGFSGGSMLSFLAPLIAELPEQVSLILINKYYKSKPRGSGSEPTSAFPGGRAAGAVVGRGKQCRHIPPLAATTI